MRFEYAYASDCEYCASQLNYHPRQSRALLPLDASGAAFDELFPQSKIVANTDIASSIIALEKHL